MVFCCQCFSCHPGSDFELYPFLFRLHPQVIEETKNLGGQRLHRQPSMLERKDPLTHALLRQT